MLVNGFAVAVNAPHSILADAVVSAHDSGTTTSLVINYEWRRLVLDLINPLLNREFWGGTESEIDDAIDKAHELLTDLYD